jgi:hypothetical protein
MTHHILVINTTADLLKDAADKSFALAQKKCVSPHHQKREFQPNATERQKQVNVLGCATMRHKDRTHSVGQNVLIAK